jgi:hypothetical protein
MNLELSDTALPGLVIGKLCLDKLAKFKLAKLAYVEKNI